MSAPAVPPAPSGVMTALKINFDTKKFELNKSSPKPSPGPGQVLLKVAAAALNPVDAKGVNRKGMLKDPATFVPGVDVVGTVAALGEGVNDIKIGSRVLAHENLANQDGSFAEYSIATASTLVEVSKLSPEVAKQTDLTLAAIPCAGWTAWQVVHDKLRLVPDDILLVWGATGGVGSFILQYAAKTFGVKKIIAIASKKNSDYALSLGATDFIDYSIGNEAVQEQIMKLSNGGVTKAADLVGGETAKICAATLVFNGILCPVVSTGDFSAIENPFGRALSVAQVALGMAHRHGDRAKAALKADGIAATNAAIDGKFKIDVTPLTIEEAPAKLADMLHAHTRAKMVIKM